MRKSIRLHWAPRSRTYLSKLFLDKLLIKFAMTQRRLYWKTLSAGLWRARPSDGIPDVNGQGFVKARNEVLQTPLLSHLFVFYFVIYIQYMLFLMNWYIKFYRKLCRNCCTIFTRFCAEICTENMYTNLHIFLWVFVFNIVHKNIQMYVQISLKDSVHGIIQKPWYNEQSNFSCTTELTFILAFFLSVPFHISILRSVLNSRQETVQ